MSSLVTSFKSSDIIHSKFKYEGDLVCLFVFSAIYTTEMSNVGQRTTFVKWTITCSELVMMIPRQNSILVSEIYSAFGAE